MKIICLILCAMLLMLCYGARFITKKLTKKDEADENIVLKIKIGTFVASVALFIISIIFI